MTGILSDFEQEIFELIDNTVPTKCDECGTTIAFDFTKLAQEIVDLFREQIEEALK